MSSDPENQDAEQLTDAERAFLQRLSEIARLQHFEARVLQKALRIHDALKRKLMDSYAENRTLRRAANELGCDVCTPEDRRILDAVRDDECPMADCFRADLRRRGIISD